MDTNEIALRAKQKGAVLSEQEKAHLITNNKHALIAFLIQQNPGYFNDVLKNQLGYNYLPFKPDHKAIGKIMETLLEKNETETVNKILAEYKFLPGTVLSQEIKDALRTKKDNTGKVIEWDDNKGNHWTKS